MENFVYKFVDEKYFYTKNFLNLISQQILSGFTHKYKHTIIENRCFYSKCIENFTLLHITNKSNKLYI